MCILLYTCYNVDKNYKRTTVLSVNFIVHKSSLLDNKMISENEITGQKCPYLVTPVHMQIIEVTCKLFLKSHEFRFTH